MWGSNVHLIILPYNRAKFLLDVADAGNSQHSLTLSGPLGQDKSAGLSDNY
jgi:hypothetical protein